MVDINMLESGLLMPSISESGSLVSFNAPTPLDISTLNVAITPVQSGTGDPNPTDNIRPITGWTGANIYVSPTADIADATTYSVSWSDSAGTVYGGTLDAVSGKLTVDRAYVTLSSLTWTRRAVRLFSASISAIGSADVTVPASEHLCDYFPTEYVSSYTSTQALYLAFYKTSGTVSSGSIYLKLTSAEITDSSSEFNQWLIDHPVHLCYVLYNPIEYDLTPTQVQTLLGINNIWADCGDTTLKTSPVFGKTKIRLMEEGISINGTSPLLRSASSPNAEEDTKTVKEPIEDIVKEPVDEKNTVKELPEDENEPEPEDEEVTEDDNEG